MTSMGSMFFTGIGNPLALTQMIPQIQLGQNLNNALHQYAPQAIANIAKYASSPQVYYQPDYYYGEKVSALQTSIDRMLGAKIKNLRSSNEFHSYGRQYNEMKANAQANDAMRSSLEQMNTSEYQMKMKALEDAYQMQLAALGTEGSYAAPFINAQTMQTVMSQGPGSAIGAGLQIAGAGLSSIGNLGGMIQNM